LAKINDTKIALTQDDLALRITGLRPGETPLF